MADNSLIVTDPSQLKKEITSATQALPVKGLEEQAEEFVKHLVDMDPANQDAAEDRKASVETMGVELQKEAIKRSELLAKPMKDLSRKSEDGGPVAKSLIDLKMQVESLDPGKYDFEAGWFSRTMGRLPGVGTPLKRYFSKFESAQTVIAAIIRSLEQGRDQLNRDNITLTEDQKRMRETGSKLQAAVQLGQLIDQKLQYQLDREIQAGSDKHKFVSEELLFPLRQRIIDLQQQVAVNQQGVLASELIIRNNKELSRGVDRALSVTVTALQVAATVAMALENQKIVLDKISSVSKSTSDLIAGTAARLKTQGVEIQKQASGALLNMDSLKAAFSDLNSAIDDIGQFRSAALPAMAAQVLELDNMTQTGQKMIQKIEQGNQRKPELLIEPKKS